MLPIENFAIKSQFFRPNGTQVDPPEDFSGLRIDAGDAVFVPNIGVDFTVKKFSSLSLERV